MERRLLIPAFLSVALVGALHHVGSVFYLYWSIGGYDLLVHFLGGLAMAVLFVTFFARMSWLRWLSPLLVVLIIGIGWEVFEYVFSIANPTGGNYISDTSTDLLADVLGGLLGLKITRRHE